MSHPVSRILAVAAALLVGTLWLANPRQSVAFGDFLNAIVDSKSATFAVSSVNDVDHKQVGGKAYFLAPARFRNEFGPMTAIADFDRGRMVSLMPDSKQAIVFELKGKPPAGKGQMGNFFGDLRKTLAEYRDAKKSQLEELGEKQIDGHRAFGFRLAANGMLQTLWGDAETGHVLRIETVYNGPPKTDVVMSDFKFDVPLDESLFSLDPPEGYKVTTVPVDVTPPTEAEFVASLRHLAEVSDGAFPPSLDTAGMALSMVKLLKGKDTKEAMTEGVTLGRGLMFAMTLPAEADAHYAGKGVKLDGPKQPIFWYKPLDAAKVRVVWSDLSTSDVETPPSVPGAVRLIELLNQTKPEKKP